MAGGHAIVIVSYDPGRDALKFANCWGSSWGDAGFGYIDRAAIEQATDEREADSWAIEVPRRRTIAWRPPGADARRRKSVDSLMPALQGRGISVRTRFATMQARVSILPG